MERKRSVGVSAAVAAASAAALFATLPWAEAVASALPAAPSPPVSLSPNASNLNSLQSKQVVATGVNSQWVVALGATPTLDACADACTSWPPRGLPGNRTRCRSFTRFNDAYAAKNASLVGRCFGHIDYAWVPIPQPDSDVDCGQVEWPCESDLDCSLNGRCDTATGACDCGASGWTGRRCETLRLTPVDSAALGFSPVGDGRNMSSWGGPVQQVGSTWHMWASRLDNHCGIQSYLLNSRVVHATASHPLGPYTERESVLPPFAHEPDVVRAPTGEFVMVSTAGPLGNYSGKQCQCTSGATSPPCGCDNSCHPFSPTISIATNPAGPWTTSDVWPGITGENPAVWITRSGAVFGMGRGGHVAVYSPGPDWRNHSRWGRGAPAGATTYISGGPDVEDPYLWQNDDGTFHALLHSLEGPHMCGGVDCQVGTHAFSVDGFAWHYGGTAYTTRVRFTDGSDVLLTRRERPHVVFAENSTRPVALSNSAEVGGAWGDRSFTLLQGIDTSV